jgi:hypothetical protein
MPGDCVPASWQFRGTSRKRKTSKGRNQGNPEWESGVASLIEAYRNLAELYGEIEDWSFRLNQHQAAQALNQVSATLTNTAQHRTRLHKWGIGWTIAALIIGAVLGFLFAKYASYL